MSDELEKKRQQKIENFKIQYDDDFDVDENEVTIRGGTARDYDDNIPVNHATNENILDEYNSVQSEPVSTGEISNSDNMSERMPAQNVSILSSYSEIPKESTYTSADKSALKAAKKADKKRRKRKAKKNRTIFRTIWVVMVLFTSVMLGEYIMVGVNDLLAVGREESNTVEVTIPKDATLSQITDILYENNIIKNKGFFQLYAIITKSTSGFTQGTFDVETNKDYQALINYMQSDMNRTDVVTIQFTEGMSLNDYAKLLEKNNVCSADTFLSKCNSDDFDEDYDFLTGIKNASQRYYKLEGYLFPDTYDFYVGEDEDSVIRKFLSNYRRKTYRTKSRVEGFDKKVTIEERAKKLGMSMEDVVTLASLIQAEAADKDDMYVVSSVLHNRLATLKTGGENENGEGGLDYLQLDSTVYYPYKNEHQIPASIRTSYVSKYSTYKYKGLPNGPICNPGLDAIEAAVSPADTEYYYFCHKAASGNEPAVPYYAKTNGEHLANLEEAGLL
ncbi:MAG: endolytic transglycosylase MltG [Clostridia bacterium]|nr:endolytic transglycosylase MltG [Clostridia bacterium]